MLNLFITWYLTRDYHVWYLGWFLINSETKMFTLFLCGEKYTIFTLTIYLIEEFIFDFFMSKILLS